MAARNAGPGGTRGYLNLKSLITTGKNIDFESSKKKLSVFKKRGDPRHPATIFPGGPATLKRAFCVTNTLNPRQVDNGNQARLFAPKTGRGFSPCHGVPHSMVLTAPLMQKTKKSVAKRFKLSGTGKLIRRTPGFRHLLSAKSTKQKRRASRDKLVAEGHKKPLMRCLPFGL
jgi:large subunit ribosomal protein L35